MRVLSPLLESTAHIHSLENSSTKFEQYDLEEPQDNKFFMIIVWLTDSFYWHLNNRNTVLFIVRMDSWILILFYNITSNFISQTQAVYLKWMPYYTSIKLKKKLILNKEDSFKWRMVHTRILLRLNNSS